MDCKNALAETDGDIQAPSKSYVRKARQWPPSVKTATQPKDASFAETKPGFGAIAALKCETDFVAKNESFRALTKTILDAAVAASAKSLDEVKALKVDGRTVEELITDEIGKTGEKMELGAYEWIEAPTVAAYEHLGNKLATIIGLTAEGIDPYVGKEVAMQVAAMNPVAATRGQVAASLIEEEKNVAIEKTKAEQVQKAAEAALRKAGLNPNHFDSEDHIASNVAKGWLTEEAAEKGRAIVKEAAEKKAANMCPGHDRQHRQRPHQQILQGERPRGAGIPPRRKTHRGPIPRADRERAYRG